MTSISESLEIEVYKPKYYESLSVYNEMLKLIKEIDNRHDEILKKEKELNEKEELFEKYKETYFDNMKIDNEKVERLKIQNFIEEVDISIHSLKEVISRYLLKYNYISSKNAITFSPSIEHVYSHDNNILSQNKSLVLYILFDTDRLKMYYSGEQLIIYSIYKQSYEHYQSLKTHLYWGNGILSKFRKLSKKYSSK